MIKVQQSIKDYILLRVNDLQLVRKNKGIKECVRFIYLTNECKAPYKNTSECSSTWIVIHFVEAMKKVISWRTVKTIPGGVGKI